MRLEELYDYDFKKINNYEVQWRDCFTDEIGYTVVEDSLENIEENLLNDGKKLLFVVEY